MLRRLGNLLKGRRTVKKEELDFSEVLELLRSVGDIKGHIWSGARGYSTNFDRSDASLSDMVSYLKDKFEPFSLSGGPAYYTNIRHEVYSGDTSERHYLELDHGEIKARFADEIIQGSSFRSASIDFLVEKE